MKRQIVAISGLLVAGAFTVMVVPGERIPEEAELNQDRPALHRVVEDVERAREYWTPERLEEAAPMQLPDPYRPAGP
ncbi:hypothetical protein [Bailinhaonella thermotolerans]|nr:hypothetical protein [Bailinhaonella thermotolerans]